MRRVTRESTRPFLRIENSTFPCISNVHETESLSEVNVGTNHGRESPSTTGIHYNVVSPFEARNVTRSLLTKYGSNLNDKLDNDFNPEILNACPEPMGECDHNFEAHECLRQDIPPLANHIIDANTIMQPFWSLAQSKSNNTESSRKVEMVPAVVEIMDHSKHNFYPARSCDDPMSELMSCYYHHSTQDTNEHQNDCIDDWKSYQLPALDDAFDCDLSRDLDPFPIHDDDDFPDEHIQTQLYHP